MPRLETLDQLDDPPRPPFSPCPDFLAITAAVVINLLINLPFKASRYRVVLIGIFAAVTPDMLYLVAFTSFFVAPCGTDSHLSHIARRRVSSLVNDPGRDRPFVFAQGCS